MRTERAEASPTTASRRLERTHGHFEYTNTSSSRGFRASAVRGLSSICSLLATRHCSSRHSRLAAENAGNMRPANRSAAAQAQMLEWRARVKLSSNSDKQALPGEGASTTVPSCCAAGNTAVGMRPRSRRSGHGNCSFVFPRRHPPGEMACTFAPPGKRGRLRI